MCGTNTPIPRRNAHRAQVERQSSQHRCAAIVAVDSREGGWLAGKMIRTGFSKLADCEGMARRPVRIMAGQTVHLSQGRFTRFLDLTDDRHAWPKNRGSFGLKALAP